MDNEKIIKDAQYRKGLSIAFFNATNAAISMVANMQLPNSQEALLKIVQIRDFFLEEHKNYYATIIANVGANYKVEDSIKKIKSVQSKGELRKAWLSLSEDERRDGEVIKAKDEMKAIYEKV